MAGSGEAATRAAAYGRRMTRGALSEFAALAAIDRRRRDMTTQQLSEAKAAARAAWSLGDYHRFATEFVWDVGPVVVAACGIGPGQRVLDVAAGRERRDPRRRGGRPVVASDLVPEHFAAGRREARSRGVELEWVEADAQALPFADGAFDVVTSSVGAIFAPDHQAVADELVRVCRPGGTIGITTSRPTASPANSSACLARHAPPPAAGRAVARAVGQRAPRARALRRPARLRSLHAAALRRAQPRPRGPTATFFKETFGPVVALYTRLAGEPDRAAELDEGSSSSPPARTRARRRAGRYRYEYLLAVAHTRA